MRPAVSLCMIVRNEEGNLRDCLAGVRSLFDEIIVVDTGSTDRTREVAKELGAKVYDFEWVDDFAAARNEMLMHATGDWVFWLDADDRIDAENVQKLSAVLGELEAQDPQAPTIYLVSVLIREPSTGCESPMGQARLFAAHAGLHWRGVVHEHVVDAAGSSESFQRVQTAVTIQHTGYDDAELHQKKLHRNLRLLQRGYLLDPNEPMVVYYLGQGYRIQGDLVTALRFYRRSIRNDPQRKFLSTRLAYAGAADCLKALGRVNEAIEVAGEGLKLFPAQPELLQVAYAALMKSNRLAEAEACLRQLLAIPHDSLSLTGDLAQGLRNEASYLLADAVRQQGRWQEAESLYRAAAAGSSAVPGVWVGLSQLGVSTGQPALLDEAMEHLKALPNTATVLELLRTQRAIMEKQWRDARCFVEAVLREDPENTDALLLLSDILYQNCTDLPAAIAVHRKVLERMPDRGDLRSRLSILETRAGGVPSDTSNPFYVTFNKPQTPSSVSVA